MVADIFLSHLSAVVSMINMVGSRFKIKQQYETLDVGISKNSSDPVIEIRIPTWIVRRAFAISVQRCQLTRILSLIRLFL